MKKYGNILLIIALLLALNACSGNRVTPAGPEGPASNSETDVQNQYLLLNGINFQEGAGAYFGTDLIGTYLYYYDQASGISGILCTNPACTHNSADCGAYVSSNASLSYYAGSLYWVAQDPNSYDSFLYRAELNGMNREKIKRLSRSMLMEYNPQRYFIHRGNLYILGRKDLVNGLKPQETVYLLSSPLDGSEDFKIIFEMENKAGASVGVCCVGDSIYFLFSAFPENLPGTYPTVVTKYDTAAGTDTVLLDAELEMSASFLWVTQQEEIFLSGGSETHAYFGKLENGSLTELASWEGDAVLTPYLLDGIAYYPYYVEGVRQAQLLDFDGNVLYDGAPFPEGVPGLDGDPNTLNFAVVGGDREKLIVNLQDYKKADQGVNLVSYTILLDVQNNLKPTILWSSADGGA